MANDQQIYDLVYRLNVELSDTQEMCERDGIGDFHHMGFNYTSTGFVEAVDFAGMPVWDTESSASQPDDINAIEKEIRHNLRSLQLFIHAFTTKLR